MPELFETTADDAGQVARIVSRTAAGIVEALLDGLIPNLDGALLLETGFIRGEGVYRPENVLCARDGQGEPTALLFSYPAEAHTIPPLVRSLIPRKRLEAVRPFLETAVPGSLFINTFWVAGELRGTGAAGALLHAARARGRRLGLASLSLFCWKDNERALRFYLKNGFVPHRDLPAGDALARRHPDGGLILARREESL
jgi:GNAT superfamily N-acetyltransferase